MSAAVMRRASTSSNASFRRSSSSSFDFNRNSDPKRRQSIWNPIHIDKEELAEFQLDVDQIRKNIFGPPLNEMKLEGVDTTICRPTTASARRSVMWSKERKIYESQCEKRMTEFDRSPYMEHKYPNISKHYPGTWRTVKRDEMDGIVRRLSKPTCLSSIRAQSAPVKKPIERVRIRVNPRMYTPSPDLHQEKRAHFEFDDESERI